MTRLTPYEPGDDYFDADVALAVLLRDRVVFSSESGNVRLYVMCNDIFAWACADAEPLMYEDVQSLYDMHAASRNWGAVRWICIKRNEQPQFPVKRDMKKARAWDATMEALPPNRYDAAAAAFAKAVQP